MDKLKELLDALNKEKRELVERMEVILKTSDDEKRELTAEEQTEYDAKDKRLDAIDDEMEKAEAEISKREKLAQRKDELNQQTRRIIRPQDVAHFQKNDEWRLLGEFFYAVNQAARGRGMDPRLNYVEFEQREQSYGVGAEGGFAIPNQFRPELMQVGIQEAIVRPRANVIPAGTPPDSSITMPALNQASSPYGGVTVTWIDEGATKPETDFRLKEITLTPHEVAAHTIVTDKLLRNWAAADSVLTTLFRKAMIGAEDTAFLRGTGVGQPLGVINSPAIKTVTRTTASSIVYADLRGMVNEMLAESENAQPIFIASPKTKTQLMAIVDPGTAGTLIWQFDARTGMPGTLMGVPLKFNVRSPGLGNTGDLMLVDLSYYLIKDGSGPFVDASPHVYFTTNKTVFKCFWNVDGQPWLDAPLALEGDTTHTVSPFVVLV